MCACGYRWIYIHNYYDYMCIMVMYIHLSYCLRINNEGVAMGTHVYMHVHVSTTLLIMLMQGEAQLEQLGHYLDIQYCETDLRAFWTNSPATTLIVVGREAAHTPSFFKVFSSIPEATTRGGAHCGAVINHPVTIGVREYTTACVKRSWAVDHHGEHEAVNDTMATM